MDGRQVQDGEEKRSAGKIRDPLRGPRRSLISATQLRKLAEDRSALDESHRRDEPPHSPIEADRRTPIRKDAWTRARARPEAMIDDAARAL